MSDYLIHYGVPGMKWGVRHDRERVGRHRFSSHEEPGQRTSYKHKSQNRPVYRANDRNDQNNKSSRLHLTDKQKKYLAIGIGVAAVSLATYGAIKYKNSRITDKTLTGKNIISRMEQDGTSGLHELFYAAYKKDDVAKYKQVFENDYKSAKQINIVPTRNIKIAGTKNAEKIFNEWKKGTQFEDYSYRDFNGEIARLNKGLRDYNLKLDQTYAGGYFKKLQDLGYQGLVDTQDRNWKMPIILINGDWYK